MLVLSWASAGGAFSATSRGFPRVRVLRWIRAGGSEPVLAARSISQTAWGPWQHAVLGWRSWISGAEQ